MPYKSDAQRRFMHWKHPKIAKKWDAEYPNQKGLPEHVGKAEDKEAMANTLNKEAFGIHPIDAAYQTIGKPIQMGWRGMMAGPRAMFGAKPQALDPEMDEVLAEHQKKKELEEAAATPALPKAAEYNMNFPERVIDALQTAAAALEKAEGERNEKQASEQKYTEKVASVIQKCVEVKYIDDTADDREKLATWLATPEGALEVIEKLAELSATPVAAALGQPVDKNGRPASQEKKASYNGYVGQRGAKSEAWDNFATAIGVG